MSINDQIIINLACGRLKQIRPKLPRDRELRKLYLYHELYQEIRRDREDEFEDEKYAALEAELETFIISPTLDSNYLRHLRPKREGIWAIRSRNPEPQIRVFSMFAERNCLISFNMADRPDLDDDDAVWNYEMNRAKHLWRSLFHNAYHWMKTDKPNKLFSGAIDERYDRA